MPVGWMMVEPCASLIVGFKRTIVIHQPIIRILICITGLLCLPSISLATTGWDRHDIQIAGFRIHGKNGASFVHAAGAATDKEPALCTNLDTNGLIAGTIGPPDFAVTDTHLAIRYAIVTAANAPAPPNHFLIRIEDRQVTGPLTHTEFIELPALSETELRWKTPSTAADIFHRGVAIVIAGISLLFLAIGTGIVIWFRNHRLRYSSNLPGPIVDSVVVSTVSVSASVSQTERRRFNNEMTVTHR